MREFSVCQFFDNGRYQYLLRYISAEQAVQVFKRYIHSDRAKSGEVVRIIVVDGGDCVNLEWQFGKGITFPPPSALQPDHN